MSCLLKRRSRDSNMLQNPSAKRSAVCLLENAELNYKQNGFDSDILKVISRVNGDDDNVYTEFKSLRCSWIDLTIKNSLTEGCAELNKLNQSFKDELNQLNEIPVKYTNAFHAIRAWSKKYSELNYSEWILGFSYNLAEKLNSIKEKLTDDLKLADARLQVSRRSFLILDLDKKCRHVAISNDRLSNKISQVRKERDAIREKIKSKSVKSVTTLKTSISKQKEEYSMLGYVTKWHVESLLNDQFQCTFHKHFTLLIYFTDTNDVSSASLELFGAYGYPELVYAMHHHVIQKRISQCKLRSQISTLFQYLQQTLGRITDLANEIIALSTDHNLTVLPKKQSRTDSFSIEVVVTNHLSFQQIILTANFFREYPFISMQPSIRAVVISSPSLMPKLQTILSTHKYGFGQLTKLCKALKVVITSI